MCALIFFTHLERVKSNQGVVRAPSPGSSIKFVLPELDILGDELTGVFATAQSQHSSNRSDLDADLELYRRKGLEHLARLSSDAATPGGQEAIKSHDPIRFWFIQVFIYLHEILSWKFFNFDNNTLIYTICVMMLCAFLPEGHYIIRIFPH